MTRNISAFARTEPLGLRRQSIWESFPVFQRGPDSAYSVHRTSFSLNQPINKNYIRTVFKKVSTHIQMLRAFDK